MARDYATARTALQEAYITLGHLEEEIAHAKRVIEATGIFTPDDLKHSPLREYAKGRVQAGDALEPVRGFRKGKIG